VSLGVLGAGNFAGSVLFPVLAKLPQVDKVAVASASGLHAQSAAAKYGFRRVASDEAELLADPAINTIAVLTRHDLHAMQVVRALQAGKHVYCEKPLALNADQLVEIQTTLAQCPSSLLMVGFNRRFAPLALRLADFLRDRQEPLVAHYRINAGFLPLSHWLHDPEQGGGRIIGEGCHFIDFLAFLVGAPPVAVQAQALPDLGRYRADNVLLTFTFPDGSLGNISYLANGDKAFPKERLEAFCGGRVAVLDDFRTLELVQNGKRTQFRSRLRQDKGHRGEWEAFAAAILSGGPSPIPYDHLFAVTRASFAAVETLRLGEKVSIG
jgi:predicted dehydrogenase